MRAGPFALLFAFGIGIAVPAPAAAAEGINPYEGRGASTLLRHVCRDAREAETAADIDEIEGHLEALRQAEIDEIARLTGEGVVSLGKGFANRLAEMVGGGGRTREELDQLLDEQLEAAGVDRAAIEAWIVKENVAAALRRLNTAGGVIAETSACIAEARAALPSTAAGAGGGDVPAVESAPDLTGFWRTSNNAFLEARGFDFYYQGTDNLAFSLDCGPVGTIPIDTGEVSGPYCTATWYMNIGMTGGKLRVVYNPPGDGGTEDLIGEQTFESFGTDWTRWSAFKMTAEQIDLEGLVPYGQ